MNVMTAELSAPPSLRPLAQLQSFSFCPACLAREFFHTADSQRTWSHCSKRWTAIRFIQCHGCKERFEFLGQPSCPHCHTGFADGVPLAPYLEPDTILDRLIKSRGAVREREKHRTDSEFAALYTSWRQDSVGTEQACEDPSTRFSQELESVWAQHRRLLDEFATDVDKFLYGAPIRLAKFEVEYSWKFHQELGREMNLVLEGMLHGKRSVQSSLGFIARYRQSFPQTYSRHYLEVELKRRFNEKRMAPQPEFQLTLEFARSLSGRDFEEWLARLLRDAGLSEVCVTQASRDQGADLVLTVGARKIVMQAKQCQDTIGNSAVQEVHGALPYYGATEAWVITTSTFSKDAVDLAFRTGVRLVSGHQLLDLPAMIHGVNSPAPEATISNGKIARSWEVEQPAADVAPAGDAVIDGRGRGKIILRQLVSQLADFRSWKPWPIVCLAAGLVILLVVGMFGFVSQVIAERQIRDLLQDYQNAELSRDASRLAECFAPHVQTFYLRRNVSRTEVQAGFDQAFSAYTEVHLMNISDIAFRSVTSNQATAEFEKTWDLRGAKNNAGAEREEMIFKRINGSWRIVSERELKVHWTKRSASH